MTTKELKTLAKLVAEELHELMKKDDEVYIGVDEICRLTGCSPSAVYHRKENGMPVTKSGKRLVAKRSEINKWIESRI